MRWKKSRQKKKEEGKGGGRRGGAEGSVLEVFVKQVIQAYSDMLMDPTKRIMLQWIIMIYFPLKPKNKLLT